VVHAFSTHDLLLRYWLAASGVDPEHEVDITVLQPAEMVGGLAADAIDGFCAGAPWGQVAAHAGLGFNALQSRDIWRDHPEKCLALRADFAARDPAGVLGMLAALRTTGTLCAAADKREALATLLGQPEYLDLPAELIAIALDPATGGPLFTQQYPDPDKAIWFAEQMARWHKAPTGLAQHAASLYRPDLYLEAGGTKPAPRTEVFCESVSVST